MAKSLLFDEILDHIAELLALARNNEEKLSSEKKLGGEVEEKIADLETQMRVFRRVTDEALKRCGVDDEAIEKIMHKPNQVLGKEKRILMKAKKLKNECQKLESEYARKGRLAKLQKKENKTAGKKRKKKFKRLGGEGWMPL